MKPLACCFLLVVPLSSACATDDDPFAEQRSFVGPVSTESALVYVDRHGEDVAVNIVSRRGEAEIVTLQR